MDAREGRDIAAALGSEVVGTRTLVGGYSHETCLLTLTDGQVVVRLGGQCSAIEAAVMALARKHVPVPQVLHVLPGGTDTRPAMILEHVAGTPLSAVLDSDEHSTADCRALGAEVGRTAARIADVTFERPGFFADDVLTIPPERPWSRQLPEFAAACVARSDRLDDVTRDAWAEMCAAHASALAMIDDHARLVHSDLNPKNILVARADRGWRVTAVLDWEFSYSGCPYADAGNMARFGDDYPDGFLAGFRTAFAKQQPTDLSLDENWAYLGHVLDMFALSELVTRPAGHVIADLAAERIRRWVTDGVPASPA